MMKGSLLTLLLFIAGALAASSSHSHHVSDSLADITPPKKPGFVNTFFDPFSGAAGSLPSSSNWLLDLGTSYPGRSPGWGNSETETYTSNSSNIAITNNHTLAITPQVSSTGIWTSGKIETRHSDFACKDGGKLFIEAKMKIGAAPFSQMQGIWPAFWALGKSFRGNYSNWPMVGEWDIYETVNGLAKMYTTIHCGIAPGGPCHEFSGIANSVDFSPNVWHTVGFQVDRSMSGAKSNGTWKDETLSWYLDSDEVFKVFGSTVNDEQAWEHLAHTEHFLILNVAVGGSFPNAVAGKPTPTNATIGGTGLEVDYVGVWNSRWNSFKYFIVFNNLC